MEKSHKPSEWVTSRYSFQDATSKALWSSSIAQGIADFVVRKLDAGMSPDEPMDDDLTTPLQALAKAKPHNHTQARGHVETVNLLIARGATLTITDYKKLLPADYALISPNPNITCAIVMATLQHQVTKNITPTYRPRLDILFATMPDPHDRTAAYVYLQQNMRTLDQALLTNPQSPLKNLSQVDREFWLNFETPSVSQLPSAVYALRGKSEDIKNLKAHQHFNPLRNSTKLQSIIDDQRHELRYLEWQIASYRRP